MLILHDSGAAPNIANHATHFPGSTLKTTTTQSSQFTTATGQPFGSDGEMTINFESQEGHHRTFTFKNADVAIPIISPGLLADDNHDALFRKKRGHVDPQSLRRGHQIPTDARCLLLQI